MKRVHGLIAVCGLSLTLSAAMAVPPVLDRVPENSAITVVIPSPQTLQKNLAALATAVEAPMQPPGVDDILAMAGIGGGIDTSKSLAIVIYGPKKLDEMNAKPAGDAKSGAAKPDADAKDKDANADAKKSDKKKDADDDDDDLEEGLNRAVILVPITKYEDFLNNFGAKPSGEGKVDSFASPTGEDGFAKNLGDGYAAVGMEKELVEQFTGKPGANPIKSRLGKAGEALADSLDVYTIVNVDRLRPLATKGLAEIEKQAKSQMEMMGGEASEKNLALAKWVGDTVVRDTQLVVSGAKVGSVGVSFEAAATFKPDSYLAKAFAGKGNSSAILSNLPAGPYIMALAVDTSTAGFKTVMKDLMSRVDMPGGEKAGQLAAAAVDNTEGSGYVVGVPETALSGIFTHTVIFNKVKDPAAGLKTFKDTIETMNGQKISANGQGIQYQTKYTENAAKAGETQLDAWEMAMKGEDGADLPAQVSQMMPMLFGPQGMPAGYVAKGPGGVYATYSKDSELMAKALGASKGDNLSADPLLKQSQELLPQGRVAEGYLGIKPILDLIIPFAQMGGVTIPADKIPEKLPPLASGISAQEGSVRLTLAVPAPVIKTGFALSQEVQKAMEGGQGGQGGEGGKPKPDKGAGQPKF